MGSSLVEIILGVTIMMGAVSVLMPTMGFTDELRLNYEAKLLAKRLEYVKELSMETDAFMADGYRVYEAAPRVVVQNGGRGYCYRVGNKIRKGWTLPPGVTITCNRGEAMFYVNGEAVNCTFTLTLHNGRSQVIVDRVGRIRIE